MAPMLGLCSKNLGFFQFLVSQRRRSRRRKFLIPLDFNRVLRGDLVRTTTMNEFFFLAANFHLSIQQFFIERAAWISQSIN
jgi:hypothetical protein